MTVKCIKCGGECLPETSWPRSGDIGRRDRRGSKSQSAGRIALRSVRHGSRSDHRHSVGGVDGRRSRGGRRQQTRRDDR